MGGVVVFCWGAGVGLVGVSVFFCYLNLIYCFLYIKKKKKKKNSGDQHFQSENQRVAPRRVWIFTNGVVRYFFPSNRGFTFRTSDFTLAGTCASGGDPRVILGNPYHFVTHFC